MKKRPTSIFTVIILVILLGYLAFAMSGLYSRIQSAESEQQRLKAGIRQQAAENDKLQYELEHSDDDQVLAQIAREELGYVYPDEVVFTAEN